MKHLITFFIFNLAITATAAPDLASAEREIKFIKPGQVKQFPPAVKKALEEDHCLIPATPTSRDPAWTKGKFAAKVQTDWAVVCSNGDGKTKIKVIWGGRDFACPDTLAVEPNKAHLQVEADKVEFNRAIHPIPNKDLVTYMKKGKRDLPKNFDQEGIAESLTNKRSIVWYCSEGRWQKLTAFN